MASDVEHVAAGDLRQLAAAIFTAHGFIPEQADRIAEVLVWANLRGVDSHGVLRIPRYLEMVEEGNINPRAEIRLEQRTPACFILDADRGTGQVAMTRAMEEAIARAGEIGICWGLVRATTHAGALGHYALMAAEADMVGIVFSASIPNMPYHGTRDVNLATNPIAIAVPAASYPPLLLDMATAVASLGKFTDAENRGVPIPEGWALDADGNPTTDPAQAKTPLPLGGPKGAGLSLMFECLASLMAANPITSDILSEGGRQGHRQNAVAVAVNPGIFTDLKAFKKNVDDLIATLKAQPKAPGVDQIFMPGEQSAETFAQRSRDGIPVPSGLWARLKALAESG